MKRGAGYLDHVQIGRLRAASRSDVQAVG
jgi:hypothetical protein